MALINDLVQQVEFHILSPTFSIHSGTTLCPFKLIQGKGVVFHKLPIEAIFYDTRRDNDEQTQRLKDRMLINQDFTDGKILIKYRRKLVTRQCNFRQWL